MKNTVLYSSFLLLVISINIFADIDLNKLKDYSNPQNSGQNININNKKLNTGTLQHTTIHPNGDIEGVNQLGEYWTYDKSSNTYYNHTTGKICKGTGGPSSECNK